MKRVVLPRKIINGATFARDWSKPQIVGFTEPDKFPGTEANRLYKVTDSLLFRDSKYKEILKHGSPVNEASDFSWVKLENDYIVLADGPVDRQYLLYRFHLTENRYYNRGE